MCASLLCHSQDSSSRDSKQFMLGMMLETLSMKTLLTLLPTRTVLVDSESAIMHCYGSNVIL